MLLVVAYDITDDRRRVRLHTLLLGYGEPVQESVFECEVSVRQKRALQRRVARLIDRQGDRVRYYTLCADCAALVADATTGSRTPAPGVYVV
jgi:CRISPR-associated protein Cas2